MSCRCQSRRLGGTRGGSHEQASEFTIGGAAAERSKGSQCPAHRAHTPTGVTALTVLRPMHSRKAEANGAMREPEVARAIEKLVHGSLVVGLLVAGLLGPTVAKAESVATETIQSAFRIELEEGGSLHRGLAVEGYLHNGLPWRITDVRLRVESMDSAGRVTGESFGWVLGDVAAGGRGYFYVPISSPATTYRATVQSFDKVSLEAPGIQAP